MPGKKMSYGKSMKKPAKKAAAKKMKGMDYKKGSSYKKKMGRKKY